jgi:hypothetical protein
MQSPIQHASAKGYRTLKLCILTICNDVRLSSNPQTQEQTKKFFFLEIDKIVYFPIQGNRGKYSNYRVQLKTTKTINHLGITTILGEFLDGQEVENNYPHTVGYYKESTGEGASFKPEYLELRKICTIEEFWLFLNASNV